MGRSRELAELASAYDGSSLGFRNRIINGDMRIDQRNAGAAVNTTSLEKYIVDRWKFFENGSMDFSGQRSTTAPAGFINSLLITTAAAASPSSGTRSQLQQAIEGLNVADLSWGTASAQSVTLSFWVRSSLTGQFGGALQNGAQNYSYPFSFTISAANTFEFKTVTIPGPTSGTWNTDNTVGILLNFDLGMGSSLLGTAGSWSANDYRGVTGDVKLSENNGATFYITGVQLEAGTVATPFERRDYGRELQLCQRYYWKFDSGGGLYTNFGSGYVNVSTEAYAVFALKQTMRATPTMSTTGTAASYEILGGSNLRVTLGTVPVLDTNNSSPSQVFVGCNVASGLTSGQGCMLRANNTTSAFLAFSAEL